MITTDDILGFVDRIVRQFNPKKIVLFGSQAHGQAQEDSDADFLVVMDYVGKEYKKAAEICFVARHSFPVDVLVRRERDVIRRIATNDSFMLEIFEKGLVLHDAGNERLAQEGRRRLRRRNAIVAVTQDHEV